jgi:hypothetical protein
MPTGAEFVNAALKRFLSQNRIANEIIDYLQENAFDIGARIFPAEGLFTYPASIVYGAGVFSLSVTPAGPIEGTDGEGHTLSLALTRQSNIAFEDDGASTYWIGMKYIEIPNGLYDNPRTGKPEYDKIMEEIGELSTPSGVNDAGGGTINMDVDNLFPAGEDNSGRSVRVWLVNPQSGDEAVAFEDVTVAWTGTDNEITTTGSLGQSTISTNGADYQIACLGVSVAAGVGNPFSSEYVILGNIDSSQAAPAGTDTGDQVDLSGGGGHTLQKAYDGLAGLGSGRTITVNDEAVRLVQSATAMRLKDIWNGVLRLRKDTDVSVPTFPSFVYEGGLDIVKRAIAMYGVHDRSSISDGTGTDELLPEEVANLVVGTANINLTRVGVDLTLTVSTGEIQTGGSMPDLCEIRGSALGQDGVYFISAVTPPAQLTVANPDGSAISFSAETGVQIRLFRTAMITDIFGQTIFQGREDFLDDVSLNPDSVVKIVLPQASAYSKGTGLRVEEHGGGGGLALVKPGSIDLSDKSGYQFTTAASLNWYHHIDGAEGLSAYDGSGNPYWRRFHSDAGAGQNGVSSAIVGGYVSFPLRLPWQADVQEIKVLCDDGSTAMTVETVEVEHDYATPARANPAQLDTDTTAGGGGDEIASLALNGEIQDPENKTFAIRVKSTAVGQRIFGIQIRYNMIVFAPI